MKKAGERCNASDAALSMVRTLLDSVPLLKFRDGHRTFRIYSRNKDEVLLLNPGSVGKGGTLPAR